MDKLASDATNHQDQMQLLAKINLTNLTPAEAAEFEDRCRRDGVTPDAKIEQLIKADNRKTRRKAKLIRNAA